MDKKRNETKIRNDYLLFIDTNIYLDTYRSRNEASISLLKHLNGLLSIIICTYQIEMEFKKNRQGVINKSLKNIGDISDITSPAFLNDSSDVKVLNKAIGEAKSRIKKIKERTRKTLSDPITRDKVYKISQAIFDNKSQYNLNRDNKIKVKIRRLAKKRFILGYPPRKEKDTSIGDAINWEWIIECAIISKKNILVVTHDYDYGIKCINDWLLKEFQDRVAKRRKIELFQKLSEAYQFLSIPITKEEEKSETESAITPYAAVFENYYNVMPKSFSAGFQKIMGDYNSKFPNEISDIEPAGDQPIVKK